MVTKKQFKEPKVQKNTINQNDLTKVVNKTKIEKKMKPMKSVVRKTKYEVCFCWKVNEDTGIFKQL